MPGTPPGPARTVRLVLLSLSLALLATGPAAARDAGERLRERIADKRLERAVRALPSEERRMVVDGRTRSYRLYVPSSAGPRAALIVVLHGTYGTGAKMELGLGFDAYARQLGFVVAYPDAYRPAGARRTLRWNDGRGVLDSSAQGIDDVAFLSQMIDAIARAEDIDRRRVFVTGASNGGIMSYRLGCELGGTIRAIAPEIGNLARPLAASCAPRPGVSVLSINGTEDPFIPLDGGTVCADVAKRFCEGGEVLSRSASMARFARASGCRAVPVATRRAPRVPDGTWVEDLRYPGCAAGAEVRSVVVHGMGHVWPPRSGQTNASGPSSGNLDATAEIVRFFLSLR